MRYFNSVLRRSALIFQTQTLSFYSSNPVCGRFPSVASSFFARQAMPLWSLRLLRRRGWPPLFPRLAVLTWCFDDSNATTQIHQLVQHRIRCTPSQYLAVVLEDRTPWDDRQLFVQILESEFSRMLQSVQSQRIPANDPRRRRKILHSSRWGEMGGGGFCCYSFRCENVEDHMKFDGWCEEVMILLRAL